MDSILTSNQTEFQDKDSVANEIYEQLKDELSGLNTSLRKEITIGDKRYTCLVQPVTSIGANIIVVGFRCSYLYSDF